MHTFVQDGSDGEVPAGGLTFDAKENLYGTTSKGRTDFACTVYQLTRETDGTWNYNVFCSFPAAQGRKPFDGGDADGRAVV